ncbi:stress-induced protein [Pseudomonas guariconensis]|uniref:Stress-induced protein n=1 Tax=Pseudomonas guariconensis TaxID=1288410 RepID=A0AAX0VVA1_9PSED|nr:stress-induced protein [Pseudomonas guariconensis]PLV17860.1 stress-induced protein [Pseudomonas guariconensis]PLV22687.1 stress-induced protein [Pseudomonas guariconensis]PLV27710.1 stress-induced protein [Pseudomonas guariconensis]
MANDQGKTGQHGGIAPDNAGGFENDPVQPSDPGQRGGQMPGEQPDWDSQSNDQGAGQTGGNRQGDQQGAGGSSYQGGTGGHTTGPKSDNEQSDIDDASQAVQDEDSGMTEDNR